MSGRPPAAGTMRTRMSVIRWTRTKETCFTRGRVGLVAVTCDEQDAASATHARSTRAPSEAGGIVATAVPTVPEPNLGSPHDRRRYRTRSPSQPHGSKLPAARRYDDWHSISPARCARAARAGLVRRSGKRMAASRWYADYDSLRRQGSRPLSRCISRLERWRGRQAEEASGRAVRSAAMGERELVR